MHELAQGTAGPREDLDAMLAGVRHVDGSVERIERDGFLLVLTPYPSAQVVEPMTVSPETMSAAVEAARAIARERGKSPLAWWVGPDRRDLEGPLEAAGLAHQDTPGFEAP